MNPRAKKLPLGGLLVGEVAHGHRQRGEYGNASDSISRNGDGSPSGVIGTVLDHIARQP
jgi:hypothetical protein